MEHADTILIAGVLLAIAIAVSLMATRVRLPGLVLFLILGIIVGPHGLGIIGFVDLETAQTAGVVALALILFEGGLASGWKEIRPVIGASIPLATIGTLLTALITGVCAAWLLDFSTLQAFLIGSIVASTDGAAVFALLRGSHLKQRLARTLEAEAGLNDPLAILLVIGFIEWIRTPDYGVMDMALLLVEHGVVGLLVGLLTGFVAVYLLRSAENLKSGLYPVATVAVAGGSFGLSELLNGSGFLAVYVAGVVVGSFAIPARRAIADFNDGLAWVCQIGVFLILGLLFVPSSLDEVWAKALIVTALLMFVARPIAVAVSTVFSRFSWRETVLLQWAGLRGAVPIVLATFPPLAGIADANEILNIVFVVVLASAILQGTTFELLARKLALTTNDRSIAPPLMQIGNIRRLGAEVFEFPVRAGDAIVGHVVSELQLPREALVNVIVRDDEALLPRGSSTIEAGDRLHILVRGHLRNRVEELFGVWRDGPIGFDRITAARPVAGRVAIFSVRPWSHVTGDPGDPLQVGPHTVQRRIRTRHDDAGALVVLSDGRYAVTSDGVVAAGNPRQLRAYAVRRIEGASTPTARAWWQEVAGAVA